MKRERLLFAIPLLFFTLLALFTVSTSSADELGPYTQIATIPNPALASFDISWVDSASGRYYFADRSAGGVDVIDAESDTFITTITGFVGNRGPDISGPDGVVVIHKRGKFGAGEGHDRAELWAGDGDSTVKVIDLETNSIVDSISTGGNHRADELAYDPVDKIILIANDADTPVPFVTFISAETRTVLGRLSYPQSTGGIEQPVWDSQRHRFYISIPATVANPNGEVDEINPKTESVTRVFAVTDMNFAGPAGLALLPGQRLITSTGVVFDAKTGATLATIAGVAGDEIWYNSGDNRVYFGNEPVFVVDASSYQVITSFDAGDTHSIAADSENNRIFIPVTSIGVKVYTDDEDQPGHE
jgi:DNA-binding beta-propeller fold protein YncE